MSERSVREILEDHLALRRDDQVEEDIGRNYASDVLMITRDGIFRGHDAVRRAAGMLAQLVPGMTFEVLHLEILESSAILRWRASSSDGDVVVVDGVDSFHIHAGMIVAATVCFTVERRPREPRGS